MKNQQLKCLHQLGCDNGAISFFYSVFFFSSLGCDFCIYDLYLPIASVREHHRECDELAVSLERLVIAISFVLPQLFGF